MKRSILLIVAVLLTLSVGAQTQEEVMPSVISSAGGYSGGENVSISLSWTLGEAFLPFFVSDQLMLTPIIQPTLFASDVQNEIFPFVEVKIYPNPASEFIRIAFEYPLDAGIDVFLIDIQGKLLLRDFIGATSTEMIINMQSYSPGVYLLRLVRGKLTNVYRIVKI
jgi:hypothetical protein